MSIRKIVAKKGTRTRQFSEQEWNLLGKDKSGWVQISDMTVENNVVKPVTEKKIVPPATGTKQDVKEIVVTNNVTPKAELVEEKTNNPEVIVVDDEKKKEFMLSLDGLSKATIKDAFDNQEPPVKYENRSTLEQLKTQLAEVCGYDLAKKQLMFDK